MEGSCVFCKFGSKTKWEDKFIIYGMAEIIVAMVKGEKSLLSIFVIDEMGGYCRSHIPPPPKKADLFVAQKAQQAIRSMFLMFGSSLFGFVSSDFSRLDNG